MWKLLKIRKSEFFAKENSPMDLEQFNKEIDQAIIDRTISLENSPFIGQKE